MIIVEDLDASVRFYQDGLGLAVLVDRTVDGDWPKLFGTPTTTLRVVFLGDPDTKDDRIIERARTGLPLRVGIMGFGRLRTAGWKPRCSDPPPTGRILLRR